MKNYNKFSTYWLHDVDILCETTIRLLVDSFYKDFFGLEENKDKTLWVQLIVEDRDYNIKTLCKLFEVTSSDKDRESLFNYLNLQTQILYERYLDEGYNSIGLRYKEVKKEEGAKARPPVDIKLANVKTETKGLTKINDLILPNTMDLSQWSDSFIINTSKLKSYIRDGYHYVISVRTSSQQISIFDSNNKLIFSAKDMKVKGPGDKEIFNRYIGNTGKVFNYVDGEQVFFNQSKVTNFITKIKKDKALSFKALTMDLETRTLSNGTMEIVSVAAYDGNHSNTWHILDYEMDTSKLLQTCFDDLFTKTNNNKLVYLHNLSNFDGMFIIKHLAAISSKFKVSKREDSIIDLTVKYQDVTLHFKDSYLLLPSSLAALGKSFNVAAKGSFDFNLLTDENSLIAHREELLKYNIQDCIVLYEALESFSKEIFKMFSLNVTKYSTLPSLAFAIYRSSYMKKEVISITDFRIYSEIASGYTGGHVDVYKPFSDKDSPVYCYDVNSLYPSVMKNHEYPVGKAAYFEGAQDLSHLFGIIEVEVDCPLDIKIPFLMTRKNGRTVAPVGRWTNWYFSEELKYAATLGYKFKVIRGYSYDRGAIFKDYVDILYNNRLNYPKSDPRNLISKLLLNSLYGRFGMSPQVSDYKLIEAGNYPYANVTPSDIVELGTKELVCYDTIKNQELSYGMIKISLPVAMAVTAYARIAMYGYKAYAGDNLLYTDTDSIFTTRELPHQLVDSKALGAMKLEYVADKAVFLAPKAYAAVLNDGSEVVKVKGSKVKLSFSDLKSLLDYNSSMEVTQERWFKSLAKGNISIRQMTYSLKVTENKRLIVYKDNKFTSTLPIVLS